MTADKELRRALERLPSVELSTGTYVDLENVLAEYDAARSEPLTDEQWGRVRMEPDPVAALTRSEPRAEGLTLDARAVVLSIINEVEAQRGMYIDDSPQARLCDGFLHSLQSRLAATPPAEGLDAILPTFEVGQVIGDLQPGRHRHDWCSIHGDIGPTESIDGHARKAHGSGAEAIRKARKVIKRARAALAQPDPDLASEYGRLLAERDRLIADGVDPADLEAPEQPE